MLRQIEEQFPASHDAGIVITGETTESKMTFWQEVYYEHFASNHDKAYWEEEKVLPYIIGCDSPDDRNEFGEFLSSEGIKKVGGGGSTTRALLVNLEFKRWTPMQKAATHSCVNDRGYTKEEFLSEVYEPWKSKIT